MLVVITHDLIPDWRRQNLKRFLSHKFSLNKKFAEICGLVLNSYISYETKVEG